MKKSVRRIGTVASLTLRAATASLALLSAFHAPQALAQTTMPACTGSSPNGTYVAQTIYTNPRTENGLYEGPVWTNGALYFSDFIFDDINNFPSRIMRLDANGAVSVAFENSGSNGIAVDAVGQLVTANHGEHGLVRFNPQTGLRSTLVNQYNGAYFNSPNDLAIAADGTIYFTDPAWQRQPGATGQGNVTGVYRRAPNGVVTLIDGTLQNPNGISLSPAGDRLYVAHDGNTVMMYPIVNGVVGNRQPFATGESGGDGMVVDCKGNLYVTEHSKQHVRVYSPQGQHIATIKVDANITNVAFGGNDRRTLYITGQKKLWKLQLSAPGYPY